MSDRHLTRRFPSAKRSGTAMALEPRMMFDAAAVATAIAVVQAQPDAVSEQKDAQVSQDGDHAAQVKTAETQGVTPSVEQAVFAAASVERAGSQLSYELGGAAVPLIGAETLNLDGANLLFATFEFTPESGAAAVLSFENGDGFTQDSYGLIRNSAGDSLASFQVEDDGIVRIAMETMDAGEISRILQRVTYRYEGTDGLTQDRIEIRLSSLLSEDVETIAELEIALESAGAEPPILDGGTTAPVYTTNGEPVLLARDGKIIGGVDDYEDVKLRFVPASGSSASIVFVPDEAYTLRDRDPSAPGSAWEIWRGDDMVAELTKEENGAVEVWLWWDEPDSLNGIFQRMAYAYDGDARATDQVSVTFLDADGQQIDAMTIDIGIEIGVMPEPVPELDLGSTTSLVTVGANPVLLLPQASLTAGSYQGSLIFTPASGSAAVLGFKDSSALRFDTGTGQLVSGEKAIANVIFGAQGGMTISFAQDVTVEQANAALRQVTYSTAELGSGSDNVTVKYTSATGAESPMMDVAISIVAEVPVVDAPPTLIVDRDATDIGYGGEATDIDLFDQSLTGMHVVLASEDGRYVYGLSADSGKIAIFGRDAATGKLTYLSSVGGVSGLENASNMVMAGNWLYVAGGDGSLLTFRFGEDGVPALTGTLAEAGVNLKGIVAQGDYVYVIGSTVPDARATAGQSWLQVYQRNAEGQLIQNAELRYDDTTQSGEKSLDAAATLLVSDKGVIYVQARDMQANGSGAGLTAYTLADGKLSVLGSLASNNISATNNMALSADGRFLYINRGSNAQIYYVELTETGAFKSTGVTNNSVNNSNSGSGWSAGDFVVSNDGKALYGLGSTGMLTVLRPHADVNKPFEWSNSPVSKFQDIGRLSGARQILLVGNDIYIGTGDSLVHYSLKAPLSTHTEGGEPAVIAPSLTLSAPRLGDDYSGSEFSIARQGGANPDDEFSLKLAGTEFQLQGDQVLLNGVQVATFIQASGSATITFATGATSVQANALIRTLAYKTLSNDPASEENFNINFKDGKDQADSQTQILIGIKNIAVNDAPQVLEKTVANPTFQSGDPGVPVFERLVLTTGEANQGVSQFVVTVSNAATDGKDFLSVDGSRIMLRAGASGETVNGYVYRVIVDTQGLATLTFSTSGGVPAQQVADLLVDMRFGSQSGQTSGERVVSLVSLQDTGGVLNGGQDTANFDDVSAIITLSAGNGTAPVANDVPVSVDFVQDGAAIALLPGTTVSSAARDALNGGAGNYDGVTVQLSRTGAASAADVFGFTAAEGYLLQAGNLFKDGVKIASLGQSGGVLTIAFTSSSGMIPTRDMVNAILSGVTYSHSGDVAPDQVSIGLTIDNGAQVSAVAVVLVEIERVNHAPVIEAGRNDLILEQVGQQSAIDGLMPIGMAVSTDGKFGYVLNQDWQGKVTLGVFSLGEDGKLSLVQRITQGSDGVDYLPGSLDGIVMSADGRSVYVLQSQGISIFSVGTDGTGKLTYLGAIGAEIAPELANAQKFVMSEDGSRLYVATRDGVVVLARDSSTFRLSVSASLAQSLGDIRGIDLSNSGDFVYVATRNGIQSYQIGVDASLSAVGNMLSLNDDGEIKSVSFSQDGKSAYALTAVGVVTLGIQADGSLLREGLTAEGLGLNMQPTIASIMVSPDGSAVYVTTFGVYTIYARDTATGALTLQSSLGGSFDYNFSNSKLAQSSDGKFIYVMSQASYGVTILRTGEPVKQVYEIGQSPVSLAPTLTLHDVDLDAIGHYEGAVLTVARLGQANAADVFALLGSSGLALNGSQILRDGIEIGSFVQQNGLLRISFNQSAMQADVQNVARSITYRNTDNSTLTVTFAVGFSDGQVSAPELLIQLDVLGEEINRSPEIAINPLNPQFGKGQEPVSLFDNIQVSAGAGESQQSITSLTLQVTGVRNGQAEMVYIDGVAYRLVNGSYQGDSYTLTIRMDEVRDSPYFPNYLDTDTATIQISFGATGMDAAGVQGLLSGMTYANETPAGGARAVSITEIRDNGGTVKGGSDVTKPDGLRTDVTLTDAPIEHALSGVGGAAVDYVYPGDPVLIAPSGQASSERIERAWQYSTAWLTVSRRDGVASTADLFGFQNDAIYVLSGNSITRNGEAIAKFTQDANGLLTIEFPEGGQFNQGDVSAVLQRITYQYQGAGIAVEPVSLLIRFDDGGSQESTLPSEPQEAVVEISMRAAENRPPIVVESPPELPVRNVGEHFEYQLPDSIFSDPDGDVLLLSSAALPDGIIFDAETGTFSGMLSRHGRFELVVIATDADGASASVTLVLNVANVAPSVELMPADPTFTEGGAAVPVFRDVVIDLNGANEAVREVVLHLENMVDGSAERLRVDGTEIALSGAASGVTAGGRGYVLESINGTWQLTLTAATGMNAADAAGVLNGMRYLNASNNPDVSTPRIITLVSIKDDGGTDAGGSDTAQVGIASSIALVAVNDAPHAISGEVHVPVLTPGLAFEYTLPADLFVDPENDVFSISLTGTLPVGLVFDPATGRITGTPADGASGRYELTLIATDVHGAQGTAILVLRVADASAIPLSQLQPDSIWLSTDPTVSVSFAAAQDNVSDSRHLFQPFGQGLPARDGIGRPLGYAPLGAAGVAGLDLGADLSGTRGLPFYINGAPSWQERAAADLQSVAAQRVSVQDSSLHGRDAQRAHAVRDPIHGAAQWDAAHGRYEYQLSDKLFQGKQAIVAIVLARPDGSPAPDGVTLDKQSGRIAVQGVAGTLNLVLIAQTRDGRELLVPVVLEVPADAARPQAQAGQADAAGMALAEVEAGKPAVSQQISAGASLAQQAEALLARLTQQG